MSKFKSKNYLESFKNAWHGVMLIWKSEKNFRIHFLIGLAVLILAFVIGFDKDKFCILILTITIVLLSEMFNSALEYSLDAMYKNKYSRLVGMAKDIAAGAVTVSALSSVIIGCVLFLTEIFD